MGERLRQVEPEAAADFVYTSASGGARRTARVLYCVSLFCGAIPLGLGVLIFLLWLGSFALGSRGYPLETAGIFLIPAGCVSVAVGVGCLAAYVVVCSRGRTDRPGRVAWTALLALLLLGANVPAAAGIVETVFYVMSRSVVVIENHTADAIEGIELVDISGDRVVVGDLPAGGKVREVFWVHGEGRLGLEARHRGVLVDVDLDEYATQGVRKHVVFRGDGTVDVHDVGP